MFKDKKIAILGFGMEGKDLANYLLREGAKIFVFDRKNEGDLNFEGVAKNNLTLICGKDYLRDGLGNFDTIFRSPGVYRNIPEIVKAESEGVTISSAIKLFFDLSPAKIIGVTGTKGKGTTATLIYEILRKAGYDVYLAGNIGKPFLELIPKLKKESLVVLELSSFQLIDMDESPHIAVVLNITQDHLDWHKDLSEYVSAKKNIVKFQGKDDFAVINSDYEPPKSFSKQTKAKVVFFSKRQLADRYKKSLLLKGEHNWENVAAAVAVSDILKVSDEAVLKVLTTFRGLEHRLELVGKVKGITFYNDSFATGPQPTIAAIRSFDEPLTVILGGSEKFLDYKGLGEEISKAKNVKFVILIGQVRQKIRIAIKNAGYKGKIIDKGNSSMEEVVREAFLNTPNGGVILLSPAAASFDMFRDYKDRGRKFKSAVKALG
ncbi:UDP-N-acetylmuramoylalanine--D-glutamate ligase [Candidatus Woesebacteria bacterium RBG_19FT_COMBO_42_9]|uniref:UDP-N-acetylmuramoylalanine--D-glutamate ligase n=1 Tax=Candidatus Woesebacteria bacterium RBG_16_42_24 TaxID=1802485 RepID=A0A1F7XK96_9BACT|nr:MAG: UDP-N-acetylmuramoylalanine--D-glutamate ligase [Candidatus Woesebacteria bacterium RBG_16_42_24]OGM17024.1 MAG: UDP-N-acetylmuramoylalanine--D-glutamate ligase [Candidatus Woesebacteria bacterium RBG_19FT_COMBO_42_9]OGM67845.1 MAG: UDP-N-acetylmuramoylalanine--D-glutamate ligase [Candidatus Woesebacteria bacterium RIFCSPLOWO2_01_FULL_43_11]